MKRIELVAAAVVGVALLAGCSRREHIREDHGVQTREFFDRQARAAGSGEAQGLDSEEAALIHESYRQTLGQRSRRTQESPMLILESTNANGRRAK